MLAWALEELKWLELMIPWVAIVCDFIVLAKMKQFNYMNSLSHSKISWGHVECLI